MFRYFIFATLFTMINGQAAMSEATGEDIVAVMQLQGDKCPPTTTDGQNWAPLPKGQPCASTKRCDFPNQWCAFKLKGDGTPDMGSLNCKPLPDPCKDALKQVFAGASGATGAPGATTTAAAGGTNPGASTSSVTETTTGSSLSSLSTESSTVSATESSTMSSAIASDSTTSAGGWIGGPVGETTPPMPGEITTAPMPGGASPPSAPGECCDYHEYCCFWAATGECDMNKSFMMRICQKSCGACGSCAANPSSCTVKVDSQCSSPDTPPGTACPCTKGHLVDRDWSPKCSAWAAKGECDKNAAYMKAICKASCNVCT